jgi:hypothetical protein
VYEWSRKFLNFVSSVTDSPRPGQAHRLVKPEAIAAVEAIVKENLMYVKLKVKVKLTLEQATKVHRRSRRIVLLFL